MVEKKRKAGVTRLELYLCIIISGVLAFILKASSIMSEIEGQKWRKDLMARAHQGKLLMTEMERRGEEWMLGAHQDKRKEPQNDEGEVHEPAKDDPEEGHPKYHMAFSTACSPGQDWQSYVFFYFAMKVKQPGEITRIASGCNDEQTSRVQKFFDEKISIMSDRFHLHFTPDYSGTPPYKYYNKPFGVRHWMQHRLGYPERTAADDDIIMILDPDQILLRPLTHDFTGTNAIYHLAPKEKEPAKTKVEHGSPFGSVYAFGSQPFRIGNLTFVTNSATSSVHTTSQTEIHYHYPAGPPYIATGRDMNKIVFTWCDFVPRVHEIHPGLLGEMFGYVLAAAHHRLPHQLMESFMVSDVESSHEGWPLIDPTPVEKVCEPFEEESLPSVLHFCQNYWLGKWFIGKYRLNKHWLACEEPLLTVPPKDIGTQFDFYIKPGGVPYGVKEKMSPKHVKREAFMICQMINKLNEVGRWFKDHHCSKESANYNETHVFHYHMDPDNNEGGEKLVNW